MAIIVAALTVAGVGFLVPAQVASAATYQTINGAGSTWVENAMNTWAEDVQQDGLTVNYAPTGSTTGRAEFSEGVVNFATSEIPYNVADGTTTDPAPARGYAYVPEVAGGLAFMYNLLIGGRRVTNLRLSGAAIAGIFTGQITRWNDPTIAADNPGLTLPATPIIPVVNSGGSSDSWELTQWMSATQGSSWTAYCQSVGRTPCTATSSYPVNPDDPAMVGQNGDIGVSSYVAQPSANGAIGYTAYSVAIEYNLPVAKVLNAAGYYTAPTPGNVGVSLLNAQIDTNPSDPLYLTANLSQVYTDTDPRTYELSYYSYLIVPTDQTYPLTASQGYSLGAFGSFLLCQGQQQVDSLGYSALPINLVEDGYAQLQKIPGAQVPATTSAFIEGCNNPTFSPDGANDLATNTPMPSACDQQGPTQCGALAGPIFTTTTVTASPNPVQSVGQAVTLTASVASVAGSTAIPVGSVQFELVPSAGNLQDLGTPVPLDATGTASMTTTFASPGAQPIQVEFLPTDPTAFGSSMGGVTVNVGTVVSAGGESLVTTVPPEGAFSFTGPGSGTIDLTVSGDTATGALVPVTVSDSRNTYPGWSVLGQITNFTAANTNPNVPISGDQLGWVPTDSSLADSATLGGTVAPAAPGLGTTPGALAYAIPGTGFGTSTLGANLTLAIPPTAPSGSYAGVLTLTADPAGPF